MVPHPFLNILKTDNPDPQLQDLIEKFRALSLAIEALPVEPDHEAYRNDARNAISKCRRSLVLALKKHF